MTTECPLIYLVNDVPRGVSPMGLNIFLAALVSGSSMTGFEVGHYLGKNPEGSSSRDVASFLECVESTGVTESQLDDELSVATITFREPPKWFKSRCSDPYGFPKKTKLGTIWKGVDMTAKDDDGRTAFIRAVIDGNLKLAETLAEYAETDINAKDNEDMTALHWACKSGLADLTAFCLSLPGLDVSIKSTAGLAAFDIAYREALWDDNDAIPTLFYKNMFEMDEYDPDNALLRLLTLTTDPRGKTTFPQEALFSPSRNGNLALVQVLLRNMTFTRPFLSNKYGETALHMAAAGGHTAILVLLLVQAGFEINAVTRDGCTALHYAAREGYIQTVKELVGHGADLDIKDASGSTAFDLATKHGHQLVVLFFVEKGASMKAAGGANGHTDKTTGQAGVEAGGQMDSNINAATSLHSNLAAHLGLAGGLAASGMAGLQMSTQAGSQTTLHTNGQISQVAGLMSQGSGQISQGVAVQISQVAGLMSQGSGQVSQGAGQISQGVAAQISQVAGQMSQVSGQMSQVSGQMSQVSGQMSQAARMEVALRVEQLLLDHGNDINRRDDQGMTPLHVAIFSRDPDAVRMLIDKGANIEERFFTWRSPLEVAEEVNDRLVVALLTQSGARSSEQNAREREPSLRARRMTVETITGQAAAKPHLQIESIAHVAAVSKADSKPDPTDDDVMDMEIPLDQELASSPTSETSNVSVTDLDNGGREETQSPKPHQVSQRTILNVLVHEVHQPLFSDISRSQTPEVLYNDNTETLHEVEYEEHPVEEYGWTSPARSVSPEPEDDEYSGGYDDGGYNGGEDNGYGNW